jgi:hypothetical protein
VIPELEVIEPVLTLTTELPVEAPPVIVIPAAESDPAPTATVELPAPDEPERVTVPLTVREFDPLIVMPLEEALGLLRVTDVAASAPSTVTVSPEAIVTVSPDPGTTPPDHVAVLLHAPPPVPLEAMAAASTLFPPDKTTSARATTEANAIFMKTFLKFNLIFLYPLIVDRLLIKTNSTHKNTRDMFTALNCTTFLGIKIHWVWIKSPSIRGMRSLPL